MGDKAIRGNRLTAAKGGRIGKFGGGRTRLLEELGRVEAEPSNRNRRAEISRVHGELNRGYAKGGRAGFAHGTPSPTPPRRALSLKEKTDPRRKKRRGASPNTRVQDIRPKKEWITKKEGLSDFQKKKVAGWEALMSTVKKGGMGADRVTSKYRSPSRAMEYFADEPGSQYEGMATKKLKELKAGKYYKDRPLSVGGRERVGQAKGGKTDKKWIQKAVDPKHKGYCTPMTKKTCTPARKALARTFKKKAKTGWS